MWEQPEFQLVGRVQHTLPATWARRARSPAQIIVTSAAAGGCLLCVSAFFGILSGVLRFIAPRSRDGSTRGYWRKVFAHQLAAKMMRSKTLPVVIARVRDSTGKVFAVRFEGVFLSGHVSQGDLVVVRLRRAGSAYVVTDGYNQSTNETIQFE